MLNAVSSDVPARQHTGTAADINKLRRCALTLTTQRTRLCEGFAGDGRLAAMEG